MNPFELEALKNCPKKGPVFMVNLVKYREKSLDGEGSGRDAYMRYGSVVSGLLETLGAVVIWMGSVDHLALQEGEMSIGTWCNSSTSRAEIRSSRWSRVKCTWPPTNTEPMEPRNTSSLQVRR